MKRFIYLIYGITAYAVFFATFLYLAGFVGNVFVPKSIDSGELCPVVPSVLADLGLILLFGIQHSVMARPGFKRWWSVRVPQPIERSTYVLITCVVLGLLFWQWRPLPSTIWEVRGDIGEPLLYGMFALGWLMVFTSSFLIDHFDLFGLRQVVSYFRGVSYTHGPLKTTGFYRWIRHPLMLGFLIAFWATPVMTAGHLLFAAAMSVYIGIGIFLEERDLSVFLGEDYVRYRRGTPMLLPLSRRARG
ncbi:MAG: isoprenylcysteine carboxylmethyltransferase family protein [Nitrospinaceae bacterium]|nr:isoprenylcysteine carboxylmethyltransferase family protein [Nitrospinaceae bacterium]NIR55433.1 isoprenylcysteine carboxylmethyltransferase family protein [Nitrospinaceae bacterium]NIS85873.1 isoprenylcysteine carboxylmethyltransferase family protein [Nitrospinaceae bacterium]NIT82717.1 isoprenylcysteine carboxylmethyltransferase family protein [Nitrospinaceae bacterium]NIU44926.1 isoprenylcysteine carboxylmethyltransferase family protein [Nitrospinaceae bacterium]